MNRKNDTLVVRVPALLKKRLGDIAEAEGRKIGNLVTLVLTQYVESRREPAAPDRNRRAAARR